MNDRRYRRSAKTGHANRATHQFWPILTRQRRGMCGPPHAGSPNGPPTRPKRGVEPAHRSRATPGISPRSRAPARQNVGKKHGARPRRRSCSAKSAPERSGTARSQKKGVMLVLDRGGAERGFQLHSSPKTSKRRQKISQRETGRCFSLRRFRRNFDNENQEKRRNR